VINSANSWIYLFCGVSYQPIKFEIKNQLETWWGKIINLVKGQI
jgi:hypothetical protein